MASSKGGSLLTPDIASKLPVAAAMANFDVRLRINGHTVEILGLNYLRSQEEAYYFSLITAFSNRHKRFLAGETAVELYHDDKYDAESGKLSHPSPVSEDFSTSEGPISYFSFGEIVRAVGELFAGSEVHVVLRGAKTDRFSRAKWKTLNHVAQLMRGSGATVLEEVLEVEGGECHLLRRVMRESEDGHARYACNSWTEHRDGTSPPTRESYIPAGVDVVIPNE